ncbi:MAG: uracil-DNA glycosylase [Pseudanabaenales cyanobacterium]|nr:uracil-DNA glycosylase [Pseudanabaenales cyanobacterium]
MSEAYQQLLRATIEHLERLRSRGVRFVPASTDAAASLSRPPAGRTARRSAPTTEKQPAPPTPETSPAAPVVRLRPPAPGENKQRALETLQAEATACVRCPNLAAARAHVVFGVGNPEAALMFVGEAPGADEDAQGEPFVGAAGRLLDKIIQAMGLRREEVYIANVLKCRPDTPGRRSGNRKPTPEEMATCKPFLLRQVEIIRPRVVVALGVTAMEGLFERRCVITRERGRYQDFGGIPVMPTYHPAYLLHHESVREKRKVWEDMLRVMETLGMEITEKQRGYFLKARSQS